MKKIGRWLKKAIRSVFEAFCYKRGQLSKTAIFLSLATLILLALWTFQSLFAGVVFFTWWTVPEFSAGAATSVMATLSALYLVNHSKLVRSDPDSPEAFEEAREAVDKVVAAVKREDD